MFLFGSGRHVGAQPDGHQHGVSIQIVFRKDRSAGLTRDQQFTSERFEWIYQESCYAVLCQGASYQPGLSTLHLDKKHLQKRHRIFRRDREPSRIPARTPNVCATRIESRWSLDFFRLLLSNCLNWKIYCDDHSSLWSKAAVQMHELFHIYFSSREERLENMFLLFTNVSVRVHLSKTLWETS